MEIKKQKVRLKRYDQIDFNKAPGQYHFDFDIAKKQLGKRMFIVDNEFSFYGHIKVTLKDVNGNSVNNGEVFPKSFFNVVGS